MISVMELDAQLQCYNCANVDTLDNCTQITTCGANERCFTEVLGKGGNRQYHSGCRTEAICLSSPTSVVSGLVGKRSSPVQTPVCQQCCGVDKCNSKLCATVNSIYVSQSGTCEDDSTFDCGRMSGFYNLCADVDHAKTVCRKFCGLCSLVDGGWSSWVTWSECSVSCGSGTSTRSRTCTNPAPEHGGLDCIGQNTEENPCQMGNCPVHGSRSLWSPWNSCSSTCGMGLQHRDRSCSNPYPALGGNHCFGDARDDRTCFPRACTDGGWSIWMSWDSCSATCGTGMTTRRRTCTNPTPSHFGRECQGDHTENQLCNRPHACPGGGWSSWSSWDTCGVTCGTGMTTRRRTCTNPVPAPFGRECQGDHTENKLCNGPRSCPVDGFWVQWTAWSFTSTGQFGVCQRNRTCIELGGVTCRGSSFQMIVACH